MRFETHKYTEEVWGAMLPVEEYELFEEEPNEIFNIVKNMIDKGCDEIPETILVTAHDRCWNELEFKINIDEYISEKQKKDLEAFLNIHLEA
jgi:hypothetical protein